MRRSVTDMLGVAVTAAIAAPKPKRTPEELASIARERQGHLRLREAFRARNPHRAAQPTSVRMRDSRGAVLDVFDDGSIRHPYRRKPGLSGRQFRKLRKRANKALRKREREETT